MSEVTTDDCRSIVWAKKDHGFDAAAGQIRQLLKRMFEYAGSRCGVTANPVLELDMKHIHKARERDRFLSAAEIGEFLRCVYGSNMRRQFKLAFHLLLITLVRKGELMGAKWGNIGLKKGEWLIPASDTKQSRDHMVYLSHQAVEIFHELHRLAGGSAYVLPGRVRLDQPFAQNALNKALREAMTESEVPYFTIHDLRRTGSTHLHEAGFNSDVIEKALGHEQRGVRAVYNKAQYADQRMEMLQEWADFVDAQFEDERKVILRRFGGQQRAS